MKPFIMIAILLLTTGCSVQYELWQEKEAAGLTEAQAKAIQAEFVRQEAILKEVILSVVEIRKNQLAKD